MRNEVPEYERSEVVSGSISEDEAVFRLYKTTRPNKTTIYAWGKICAHDVRIHFKNVYRNQFIRVVSPVLFFIKKKLKYKNSVQYFLDHTNNYGKSKNTFSTYKYIWLSLKWTYNYTCIVIS